MKTEQRFSAAYLAQGGVIAAFYVALTVAFAAISFGPIQFRISEALVILPVFTPAAIPGVTLGCFLSNLLAGAPVMDVVFGTAATLLGAIGTRMLREKKLLSWIPPVISNGLIIPWVLKFAYHAEDLVPFMMLTVAIGEVLAVGVLGNLLRGALETRAASLFRGE